MATTIQKKKAREKGKAKAKVFFKKRMDLPFLNKSKNKAIKNISEALKVQMKNLEAWKKNPKCIRDSEDIIQLFHIESISLYKTLLSLLKKAKNY